MHNNIIIGAAEYDWSCTDADDGGCRYIPSISRDEDLQHIPAVGGELHIYNLSDELSASCYGRVIAIEYCYQFDPGEGPTFFNWTVLILKETDHSDGFNIRDIITIENCEPDATSCRSDQPLCCDMIDIESFDLYISDSQNFIFGVTESAQGNTAGAALLGFPDSLPRYQVDVLLFNRADVNLSIGSTIKNKSPVLRGIRMLWFVIGKLTFTTSRVIILCTHF